MAGFYSSPPLCGEEESQTPLTHTPSSSLSSSTSLISPPPRLSLQPSPAPVSGTEWPPRHRPGSGDEGLRMESGIQMHGSRAEGTSSSAPPPTHEEEEAIWHMNLTGGEAMDMGPFPERPGEPDCAYYIRTGLCKYGMTCRYNHPPNRKLVVSAARIKGGFPERAGQPECQYYLKTGTCKFGATCKFHHPRDKAGIVGRVQLNILGYPLRMNEKECAYYLRTGQCKFGNTCKFNHPQPSNAMASVRGSSVYPSVHTPTSTGQQSYPGGLTNWPLSRAFVPSPRWQGPSSYAQLILPQGLVQVPNWTPYPGHVGSVSTPETLQRQSEATSAGSQGGFSSYQPGAIPMGLYSLQRENIFPERPDQPECQFYMKTGDCKFGAVCKFHHPRDRSIPVPNCALSPMGLPLRQGEPMCIFYSRYGICKFGPNCKFDHPMGTMTFGVPSSSGPPALTLPSDRPVKVVAGKPRRSPTESQPSDENTEAEGS